MRQQRSRYAIRAGRNLPDKEFRYLRMVIVTTAVYWGLNSPLRPQNGLTGPLNLPAPGRRQSVYINAKVFARTCVFSKQSLPSCHCGHTKSVAPLLPKLRGQFAEFLNYSSPERLSILYLTTSVGLGYGPNVHSLEAFLGSMSTPPSTQKVSTLHGPRSPSGGIYLTEASHRLHRAIQQHGVAALLRHPITWLLRIRPHATDTTPQHPKAKWTKRHRPDG